MHSWIKQVGHVRVNLLPLHWCLRLTCPLFLLHSLITFNYAFGSLISQLIIYWRSKWIINYNDAKQSPGWEDSKKINEIIKNIFFFYLHYPYKLTVFEVIQRRQVFNLILSYLRSNPPSVVPLFYSFCLIHTSVYMI